MFTYLLIPWNKSKDSISQQIINAQKKNLSKNRFKKCKIYQNPYIKKEPSQRS